jgi:hypothetical protein
MVYAIDYNEDLEVLEVEFTSGSVYRYEGVPKNEYYNLINSDSIGSFMRTCIIGVYPDHKIR